MTNEETETPEPDATEAPDASAAPTPTDSGAADSPSVDARAQAPSDAALAEPAPTAERSPEDGAGAHDADGAGAHEIAAPELAPVPEGYRSGFVALVGRPNAGKSTLLNRLVGEKVAIVSNKPQTTRTQIRGFISRPDGQVVFVDTPGIHKPGYALNRRMMQIVSEALLSVDLVMLLVDASARRGAGDRFAEEFVFQSGKPVFLVLTKVDLVKDKARLLPMIQQLTAERDFAEVIPISSKTGRNVDSIVDAVLARLPLGPRYFPDDEYTDQPMRMLAAELVREKLLHQTGDELPYVTAVVVERWDEGETLAKVYCLVYVERDTQRVIIIGKGGQRLKDVGSAARAELETILGKQVYLQIHVVVRERWRNDERMLDQLGIDRG